MKGYEVNLTALWRWKGYLIKSMPISSPLLLSLLLLELFIMHFVITFCADLRSSARASVWTFIFDSCSSLSSNFFSTQIASPVQLISLNPLHHTYYYSILLHLYFQYSFLYTRPMRQTRRIFWTLISFHFLSNGRLKRCTVKRNWMLVTFRGGRNKHCM